MRNDAIGTDDIKIESSASLLRDFSSYLGASPMFEASGLYSSSLPRFSLLELVSLFLMSYFYIF